LQLGSYVITLNLLCYVMVNLKKIKLKKDFILNNKIKKKLKTKRWGGEKTKMNNKKVMYMLIRAGHVAIKQHLIRD